MEIESRVTWFLRPKSYEHLYLHIDCRSKGELFSCTFRGCLSPSKVLAVVFDSWNNQSWRFYRKTYRIVYHFQYPCPNCSCHEERFIVFAKLTFSIFELESTTITAVIVVFCAKETSEQLLLSNMNCSTSNGLSRPDNFGFLASTPQSFRL